MIIKSQNVFTGNSDKPEPLSLLIHGEKIEAVLPYHYDPDLYPGEAVRDYEERLIMPSFIDAHTHIISGAVSESDYVCNTLGECKSQEECVERMKEFAHTHPELHRLRGTGWFVGAWEDAPLPDKRSLDEAFPETPVYLQCADAHSMWMNSAAIKEAGYTEEFTVENGEACRFSDGSLSGLFLEPAACEPAMKKYMEFSQEEMKEIHVSFQKKLASYGIAAVSEMFAEDYTEENKNSYEILKKLDQENQLNSEIFVFTKMFGYTDFAPFFEFQKELNTKHFHIAGVKGFLDGVTETYTGLLLEPYEDRKETCGEGLPLWPKEKMQKEIIAANRAGISVRLHCIADGSVRMALDMFEQAQKQLPDCPNLRNTIEHIENIHPSDLKRFRQFKVIPSMQPYHVTLSNNGKIWRLGKERCKYEFPVRSVYEAAGEVAIGTDFPVVSVNPFLTIYAALTRLDDEGKEVCQNGEEQKLPVDVVLKSYTQTGAKVYGVEEQTGTLEAGKLANFIVLSKNPFAVSPEEFRSARVLANYFEGSEVYYE